MKVLVVGGGGREHALCYKIAQSEQVDKIYCAPGNAGIDAVAECVAIPVSDHDGLVSFAKEQRIDLTVVGPEDPLCAGIRERFETAGLKLFGADRQGGGDRGQQVVRARADAAAQDPAAGVLGVRERSDGRGLSRESSRRSDRREGVGAGGREGG